MASGDTSKSGTQRSAVVLLSGGLDSAVALGVARAEGFTCHALTIDYHQRHRAELAAAARVVANVNARYGGVTHKLLPLDLRAIGGSALTADIDVPKDRDERQMSADVPVTYVPARNLVFLSLAAGYAESLGAADLFIGVNAVDYSGYPDCRPQFIESLTKTLNLATAIGAAGRAWTIHTPLVSMTKAEIIRAGVRLGVDLSVTHSCYDPVRVGTDWKPCGHCDSCLIRARGFAEAGLAE